MFGHKKAKDEFEILFKENYNKLYVFAYNYLNDKEISEDVVNDAFEYVWRNYDNLKNNSLVPVLFQQVRHRSFNYLRHNKIVEKYASVFIYTTSELEDTQENDDPAPAGRNDSSPAPEGIKSSFRYCPACGKRVEHDSLYCSACGKKLS